jgi:hypothetical protein
MDDLDLVEMAHVLALTTVLNDDCSARLVAMRLGIFPGFSFADGAQAPGCRLPRSTFL